MNDPPDARAPDPDAEIEALLHFEPVARHTRRHDGWSPSRQYGFIAALARLGDVDRAAHSVGRASSGAWKVRTSAGAEGFAESWDSALDLFHARNPRLKRRGGRARQLLALSPPADEEPGSSEAERKRQAEAELVEKLLRIFWIKLGQERQARLEGRIVAADFYVRQLSWFEVAIDLSEGALALFQDLRREEYDAIDIVATPASSALEALHRAFWQKEDEPDRPPPTALGRCEDGIALGEQPHWEYRHEQDGKHDEWRCREDDKAAFHRAAQQAWEERARAGAQAWARRVAAKAGADPLEASADDPSNERRNP